jgi:hypothetical protein
MRSNKEYSSSLSFIGGPHYSILADLTPQPSVEAHFDLLLSAIIQLVVFAIYLNVDRQESKIWERSKVVAWEFTKDIDTETGSIKSVHNGMYYLIWWGIL